MSWSHASKLRNEGRRHETKTQMENTQKQKQTNFGLNKERKRNKREKKERYVGLSFFYRSSRSFQLLAHARHFLVSLSLLTHDFLFLFIP